MTPEDKWEIEALLHRAAQSLDERDLDEMEKCFAEDVQVIIRISSSGVEEPMNGRKALMDLVRARLAEQTDRRRHVISNLTVTSNGSHSAHAISYLTLIGVANGIARLICTGCYKDEVERRNDKWLIVSRDIDLDLPY